ncbi:uncharacterized protein LOC131596952 [Vicia villosa]|uniref:uncharacterized protein LOC131596952 n=1 Tax=Vicia villosa TaxID=3911 RepID=UPI00273CDFBF|nr:uncharacterized protein LOC131596952 [Vicia villosa]
MAPSRMELRLLLEAAACSTGATDVVSWEIEKNDSFSINSCYHFLQVFSLVPDLLKVKFHSLCNLKKLIIKKKPLEYEVYKALLKSKLEQVPAASQKEVANLREAFIHAFGLLWKLEVPFKIKAFGWRLFLDRLPVKDLLKTRGISIPLDDLKCLFCGNSSESSPHLFFSCLVVQNIWSEIANWVGKGDNIDVECLSNFMDWHLFFGSKKVKVRKLGVVWLATTWTIWLVRNEACFRKEAWNVNNTVWNIKHLVWRWSFCGKITHPNYSFYEFCKDPLHFLS